MKTIIVGLLIPFARNCDPTGGAGLFKADRGWPLHEGGQQQVPAEKQEVDCKNSRHFRAIENNEGGIEIINFAGFEVVPAEGMLSKGWWRSNSCVRFRFQGGLRALRQGRRVIKLYWKNGFAGLYYEIVRGTIPKVNSILKA